jgi:Smr domain
MVELDVHGLTVDEALKAFVEFYNRLVQSRSREPVRVVHGWGSSGEGGKIRLKLRQLLADLTPNLDWKPGEDIEGNLGVTIVYPSKVIDVLENQLAAAILEFCSTPRTESKISGQFRKYEPRKIKEAIRLLVRRGQMKQIVKGDHVAYLRP